MGNGKQLWLLRSFLEERPRSASFLPEAAFLSLQPRRQGFNLKIAAEAAQLVIMLLIQTWGMFVLAWQPETKY